MKSVLDQYQQQISELESFQNLLSNLDENNLQTTKETLSASKYIQAPENLKIIMKMIKGLIKYRKKHLHCFFAIIDLLLPIISANFSKKEVMFLFSEKLIFLKFLHDNYISIEDIVSFYGVQNEKLLYFYPEIKDFFSKNSYFQQNLKTSKKYKDIVDYFSQREGEKIGFEDDPRLQIGNVDQLSVLIQKDDIDSFKQLISQSNINIQKYKIILSDFEVKKLLYKDVYLIEYAAFHGALKIFKFLYKFANSQISNELYKYAICGGNNEIIHISENALDMSILNINSVLPFTVFSHHNELSDYLIDNFDCQFYHLLAYSIYCGNYSIFFNHFMKFVNEYNQLLNEQGNNEIDPEKTDILSFFQRIIKEIVIACAGNCCSFLLKIVVNFKNVNLNDHLSHSIRTGRTFFHDKITNPLFYSIQTFNNENARFLLSFNSVDPNYFVFDGMTPFIWACFVGNCEMAEFLYNVKKVDISNRFDEALRISTQFCHFNVVKYLISLDILDLQQKINNCEVAIKIAAKYGYKYIFDFLKSKLIESGIKIDDNLELNEEKFYPSHYFNPLKVREKIFSINLPPPQPYIECILI